MSNYADGVFSPGVRRPWDAVPECPQCDAEMTNEEARHGRCNDCAQREVEREPNADHH